MKIFISQPMRGIPRNEVLNRRQEIIEALNDRYLNENIEYLFSVITEYPNEDIETVPVWYLAKAIDKLSMATLAYFDKGWDNANGCTIEHMICELYKIKTLDYTNLFNKE